VTQPGDEAPQCGQGQADHAARRSLDPLDEGTGEPVNRESPGQQQRLTRRDVRFEFGIADI